jgi:PRC-barrel domain
MHFTDPKALLGLRVIGREDVALGVVEDVYADVRTGCPQWAAIRSGLFGADLSLVPLAGAEHDDCSLHVPFSTPELRNAPHRAPGIMMSHKEEANLFSYYGFSGGAALQSASGPAGPRHAGSGHGAGRTMLHKYTRQPPD